MNTVLIRYFITRAGTIHIIDERTADRFIKGLCGLRMPLSSRFTDRPEDNVRCKRCEDFFHDGSYMWSDWSYEGTVEFSYSGYEGYTVIYVAGEEGQLDLAEVLADHFAKYAQDKDFWQAAGQLRINIELLKPFTALDPENK